MPGTRKLSAAALARLRACVRLGLCLCICACACSLDRSGLQPGDAAAGDRAAAPDAGGGGLDGAVTLDGAQGPDATDDALPVSVAGCADGTREGFMNQSDYPAIAACSGGWDVPGLVSADSRAPQCGRRAGNHGALPGGAGCSAADLCAAGWHVCERAAEVEALAGDCETVVSEAGPASLFFATRQRATGQTCDGTNLTGTNNLHGCGSFGSSDPGCAPFGLMLRDVDCAATPPWHCTDPTTVNQIAELSIVIKTGSTHGGVLCCRD